MSIIWQQLNKGGFIIAEAGKNFVISEEEESLPMLLLRAKELALEAKRVGASAVKFQCHVIDDEILPETYITSPHFDLVDRYTWVKRNTYPLAEFWKPLKEYCDRIGILFFATPMSLKAAELLNKLGVELWKIGSGDISDFVLLDYVRKTKKPIIISSGMHSLEELQAAYDFIYAKNKKICVLHCVSKYPCTMYDLNLEVLKDYAKRFYPSPVGLSDHSLSLGVAGIAQKYFGAKIIEKHFTIHREAWGSDHKVSLEPYEFNKMIHEPPLELSEDIIKKIAGIGDKHILSDEMGVRKAFKKKLVAARDMEGGHKIVPKDLMAVRGIELAEEASNYMDILGLSTLSKVSKYDIIIRGKNVG